MTFADLQSEIQGLKAELRHKESERLAWQRVSEERTAIAARAQRTANYHCDRAMELEARLQAAETLIHEAKLALNMTRGSKERLTALGMTTGR